MGGQNHQPTNQVRLIAPSAWLSQKLGEGLIEVLQSNNELENAIIVGMEFLHVVHVGASPTESAQYYINKSIENLQKSLQTVDRIQHAYTNLLDAAAIEGYRGNPLASRIGEFDLSDALSGTLILPAVNQVAWKAVEAKVETSNILAALAWEAEQFSAVRDPTERLISVLQECLKLADQSGARVMVEAIEKNEVALRQEFAKVFSLWNHLHAMFLYSAVMMTELFYMTNDYGSLLADPPESRSDRAIA